MTQSRQGIWLTDDTGIERCIYEPTPKQLEFHSRTEPNVLFWGGRGSGKSKALRMDAHLRAISHPNFTYIILRRTFPELQKSHLVHVPSEMKMFGGTFNYTNKIANYPNGSKGFFSHCATDEDVLNLLSAEFAWAGFDELSTFEWEMFTKLAASVRVPVGSELTAMVRAATNPLGPSAQQIMQYFVNHEVEPEEDPDYNPNDWYSIHANLEDNPHLDQDQYRKRFSGLAPHIRKAWVEGEFVLENALFDFYPKKDGKPYHVINELDIERLIKAARIYRVYDHGWAPDPAYCAWIAHLGNRYIVFHEQIWLKTIVPDIAEDIKETDKMLGIDRVVTTYCDPTIDINTGTELRTNKDIFEAHGISMECSVNKRDAFASVVHTALHEEAEPNVPRLQIYVRGPKGAPYLAKAIPMQRYDLKRPMFMADQKDDHPVVAVAYFLLSHSSEEMRSYTPKILKRWMRPKKKDRFILGDESVRDK